MAVPGTKPQDFAAQSAFAATDRIPFVKDAGGGMWADSYILPPDAFKFGILSDVNGAYTTANALYAVNGTANGLQESTTLLTEPAANQYQIARGTSALLVKANFTVNGIALVNQDTQTTASPTWVGATLSGLSTLNGIVTTNGSGVLSSSVTLPDGTLAITQSLGDNSTKLATTGYVDASLPVEQQTSEIATAAQTVFALPSTPDDTSLVKAFRNGNKAINGTNFTVSGSTLTWVTPTLVVGEEISTVYNDRGITSERTIIFTIEDTILGSIPNGTFRFSRPRFNGTIISIIAILVSGTADLDINISGTPVTHTTLNLSSTETSQAATANNTFTNSDFIEYTISNASSSDRMLLTIECSGVI